MILVRLRLATLVAALTCLSCTRTDPPKALTTTAVASPAHSDQPKAPSASAVSSPLSAAVAPNSAVPSGSAVPSASSVADHDGGDAQPAPTDWTNKAKPNLAGPSLEAHARRLLDAIVKDDPELARDFFFPRAPFTPLKDVSDPDRYWVQLFATYKRDVHALHHKRRDWSGVQFDSFSLGSPPTWVKPGDEYNKIGYYRTFRARLQYSIGDRKAHIDVQTIISWNGDWYITHLLPIKH